MKNELEAVMGERTLVLIKPDAVMRGLVGSILHRFEQTGLKQVALKMVKPTTRILRGHFPDSEEWISGMGQKTIETYLEYDIDPATVFDTNDALEIGRKILSWNYNYLTMGPVVVIVYEGVHAVGTVRKLIGDTLPFKAAPGTIRGDYSINAPSLANLVGSSCKNVVHASGTVEEACHEIKNWFHDYELIEWQRADHFVHFLRGEHTTNAFTGDLKMQYEELETKIASLKEDNPREAAEHAYALAMLHKEDGNDDQAVRFGQESISLFDLCETDTIEDCCSRNQFIDGIPIPDLIHQGVVRNRLQPLSL